MKKEFKFLITVVSVLLVSTLILVGCMQALSQNDSEPKDYDMDIVSQTVAESTPEDITKDPPAAQNDMQKKFSDMSEISEDGKTITVITEEYLKDYWRSNYEKEVIHSLTTEEVYFIIQDSIRIYEEYDEVALTDFASVSSMMQVTERFPFVKDEEIKTQPDVSPYYEWGDTQAIYEIILYRLKALSSPKAFFTGEEAMRSVGEEPGINSTMLPWTTFYIPNYSESTNRDYILNVVGYGSAMNSTVIEDEFSELFGFCNKNGAYINFESKSYEQSTKIFPTAEMESSQANMVIDIIDRTEESAYEVEPFWEDDIFVYSFPCIQSQSVFALMYDGREILLVDALKLGYITPKEFDNFNFRYWRSVKRAENVQTDTPYFKATATYTDKKRADVSYPYASFIPDTFELVKYYNNIMTNNLYVTDKGTPDVPSFIEMYKSYDGPWFGKNSLILAVIESDSNVLPKVSSIIVDGSTVEVYFDPESLGKKQDQVYTVFLETNKIDIENVNIFTERPYSKHPLYEKYPEYFGLDGMKGVEVYVWQIEDGSYRCGALKGTNRMKTNEEIQALFENGATIEEMRTILEFCEVDKSDISVIPVSDPLESDWYQIDIDEIPKYQEIFWGE